MNNLKDASLQTESDLQTEIHLAEIDRSLALVAQVWSSNLELSVDEMCEHLVSVGNIVDGTSFSESSNLSGLERLN